GAAGAQTGPGEALYRTIVAPTEPFTLPNASVVVVPDGALHRLNFETLPVTGSPHRFLIERVDVQVAPSLSLLTIARSTGARKRSLLLIGNPTPHEPEYPALSYASVEMAAIARHFAAERVVSFQGAAASPSTYRASGADAFQMIHFTAHATANADIPLDSA